MSRIHLSGKVGASRDPCAAIMVPVELVDGQSCEIVFMLGSGSSIDKADALVRRFRGTPAAKGALAAVREYWKHTLEAVRVETPDKSVNILANGWLLYQVISARLWGRTGYYQSGGAFGFRDQLQDVMALNHAEPALIRKHLFQ